MKKILALVIALSMVLALCAGSAYAASNKKTELKWGSVHTEDALATQMMRMAIEEINANAEGITIVGYPNGVLGGSQDLIEGVQYGLVDLVTDGPAQFASVIPKTAQVEAPFLYRDVEHLMTAMNGAEGYVATVLQPLLDEINVQVVGTFYYGTRQLTVNKPVNTLADLAGMKIRVPQVDLYVKMVEAWGAAPTPMPLGDLYLSLQTGSVDGQENPLTTYAAQKFYETNAKYVIMDSHIICPNMIFMNQNVYNNLSEHDREVVDTAMANAVVWMTEQQLAAEEKLVGELEELGCTVIYPDETIREATVPAIQPAIEDWDLIQSY